MSFLDFYFMNYIKFKKMDFKHKMYKILFLFLMDYYLDI